MTADGVVAADVGGDAARPDIAGDDRVGQRRRGLVRIAIIVVDSAAPLVAELPLTVQAVSVAVP